MSEKKHSNEIFIKYKEKTLLKESFYKNNNDILYIGIYPDDIKNNYEGSSKKLYNLMKEIRIRRR